MLKASGIYKKHGSVEVLRGLDLVLNRGQLVTIVGPSGCGKSTLLHILGTLDQADQGAIELEGVNLNTLSGAALAKFRNQKIGFVFQFHHLLPEFTALENVSIPAWIAGRKRTEVNQEATELLGKLGLKDRITHKPGQLSGGEQQRVAVARALINRPSIVLADEPTGNLDGVHAGELHSLFHSLKNELGQTFLIVTHNKELAAQSDRVLTMRDGKFEA
ncbi:MAG: ABC transporter ATP-binding protein [Bacteroidetes bacterium]|nr:ABC transporter ATP-binding protein [Bacteroidota bacterium]